MATAGAGWYLLALVCCAPCPLHMTPHGAPTTHLNLPPALPSPLRRFHGIQPSKNTREKRAKKAAEEVAKKRASSELGATSEKSSLQQMKEVGGGQPACACGRASLDAGVRRVRPRAPPGNLVPVSAELQAHLSC